MDEGGRGGLWAGLIISLAAAVIFGILWYLRGGANDRLQSDLNAARAAASSAEQRLESNLRSAQNDNSAKDRRIAELETSLRDDVRRAQEAGQATERRLQLDLDLATSRLAEAQQETDRLIAEANDAAQAEMQKLREDLARAQTSLGAITREPAAISAAAAGDSKQLVAGLEEQLGEARKTILALENKASDNSRRFAEIEEELKTTRQELERLNKNDELAGALENLEAALAREQDLSRQLRDARANLAAREADFAARMTAARDAALARVEALEKEYEGRLRTADQKLSRRELELRRDFEKERESWRLQGQNGTPVPSSSPAPSFAEGRIVGRLPDGSTFLISGGAEQRVRPGLKFDAYRPDKDGAARYIGAVRVIRVMDGYSLAVSAGGGEAVRVCPETGRVIMDPVVQYSPFAPDKEPVSIEAEDGVFDAPTVGDCLDNPFFTTSRPLRFGLDGNLAGNDCVLQAIADLGGIPCPADTADLDFLLVRDDADAGKRISLDHLANYLDPRPVFCE